jgi:hypothetical protein
MQSALAAHREHEANGMSMFFTTIIILLHVTLSLLLTMLGTVPGRGLKCVEGWTPHIWKQYGVPNASFYKARAWEALHPGQRWSGNNIRLRGKVALLTHEMESELNHWVAVSQRTSGGVEQDSVCRVAFALMSSDHKEYLKPEKRSLSREWFFN